MLPGNGGPDESDAAREAPADPQTAEERRRRRSVAQTEAAAEPRLPGACTSVGPIVDRTFDACLRTTVCVCVCVRARASVCVCV